MVQFNLLPDVKRQFIKARRTKHMMTLVSMVVIAVSLFVFVLFFANVTVVQKKSLSDLNKDIKTQTTTLKSTKNLDKILTVQNQLSTLSDLHSQKYVSSRLFGFLAQMTPAQVSLSNVTVNFDPAQRTISLAGDAPSLDVVNTYVDTFKKTTFTTTNSAVPQPAFTQVVLSSFSRDDKSATFTITASFDQALFSNASTSDGLALKVPPGPTVDPAALFNGNESENQ